MKTLFLFFCILICTIGANAQLTVNAGRDTILCCCGDHNENDSIFLGGNPVATGGVEPYIYTWSGKLLVDAYDSTWIYASDFLNDTTLSNPGFKRGFAPEEWFTFHLKVEDANGSIQYDSIKIVLSSIGFLLDYILPDTIFKGDSTQLIGDPYVIGNFSPYKYYITPSHGLSDSTNIYGWAKPDSSITYYFYVIDSVGCISAKVYYWHIEVVDTTSGVHQIINTPDIHCFFSSGKLVVQMPEQNSLPYNLSISAVDGRIIHAGKYKKGNMTLPVSGIKKNQLYVVAIENDNFRKVFKLFNGMGD